MVKRNFSIKEKPMLSVEYIIRRALSVDIEFIQDGDLLRLKNACGRHPRAVGGAGDAVKKKAVLAGTGDDNPPGRTPIGRRSFVGNG